MTPYERLIETRKLAGASSWRAYAAILGLPNAQSFTDIRLGKHGISRAMAEKIKAVSPDINTLWLLTGEGLMMRHDGCNTIPLIDGSRFAPADLSSSNRNFVDAGSEFDNPSLAAKNVTNAMAEYPNDAIMILREADTSILIPGTDYLFVASDFVAVRRLQLGDNDTTIKLYATSTDTYPDGLRIYEPITLERSRIDAVYKVIGYIVPSIVR